MAKGQVIFVSRNQGMIVVRHDDGFAVVELLGSEGEFQLGDIVAGDWSALGGDRIFKDGEEHDVYLQGNWGSLAQAIRNAQATGGG